MTRRRWRHLRATDLAEVAAIAESAFPNHNEDPACFAERLALSPAWCFALDDGIGPIAGYSIAYPWPHGTIPPLNTRLGPLPDQSDALFLHDLAVRPEAAGSGQAGAIVEQIAMLAETAGFDEIALVAVNGTVKFWRHHGFTIIEGAPTLKSKLAAYGADARYMRRQLTPCSIGHSRNLPK